MYSPIRYDTTAAEVAMASTNLISAGWSLLSNCFAPRVLSILSILEGAIVNSSYEDPLVEKQNIISIRRGPFSWRESSGEGNQFYRILRSEHRPAHLEQVLYKSL